ncbi:MAG: protein BatD, partial [Marinobacter sp.]
LISTLEQTIALVPVQAGEMTLPEIRIAWWDTNTDSQQVAMIPARTLSVTDTGAAVPPSPQPPADGSTTTSTASEPEPGSSPEATDSVWPWVSLALAVAWAATVAGWWWSGRNGRGAHERPAPHEGDGNEQALFDQLIIAARKGSAETPHFLIRWMQHRHPDQLFHTAGDVVKFLGDDTLATELEHLQAELFAGQGRSEPGGTNRQALVRALEQVRRRKPKTAVGDGLRPLYPDNLSA